MFDHTPKHHDALLACALRQAESNIPLVRHARPRRLTVHGMDADMEEIRGAVMTTGGAMLTATNASTTIAAPDCPAAQFPGLRSLLSTPRAPVPHTPIEEDETARRLREAAEGYKPAITMQIGTLPLAEASDKMREARLSGTLPPVVYALQRSESGNELFPDPGYVQRMRRNNYTQQVLRECLKRALLCFAYSPTHKPPIDAMSTADLFKLVWEEYESIPRDYIVAILDNVFPPKIHRAATEWHLRQWFLAAIAEYTTTKMSL